MRTQGKLKLGYYPLSPAEARRIRKFLHFDNELASVLDPCAGTGAALSAITDSARVRRYGVELDAYRSAEARKAMDEVIQGSAFDTHAPVESFSLVYLNPPYDFEIGEGKNQRMERLFLEHVGRWVRPGGVLVMVIPFDRVYDCRGVLTLQFRDKAICRLTEPEAVAYQQVVVFGVRRTRQERQRLTDHAVQQANRKLNDLTRNYEEIPVLPEVPDRAYAVPPSPPARLEYRGLPLDLVEDLLATSPAWRQAQRITHAPKTEFSGRPLTPLHKGHVGLLCTSGLLNGVFGEGQERHVANWESVKVVDKTEEESEDGRSTVIREKERFSQRLTLLYADGRIALLSEKAPTAADTPNEVCAMPRMAEGRRNSFAGPPSVVPPAIRSASVASARLASPTHLMPPGSGLTMPRLNGIAPEQQCWDGEQAAARVGLTFLKAGIGDTEDWAAAKQNPFHFLNNALDRWVRAHGKSRIKEQFRLSLTLSTDLEGSYGMGNDEPAQATRLFLTIEPSSAGYIVLGPTLRMLEAVHPRLPATFAHLFLGALNRWIRVYDYRDARERVDTLREWYESDPESENLELPDIDRSTPLCMKRRPLSERVLLQMLPKIRNRTARRLVEQAVEVDRLSCQAERPVVDEEVSASLIDCGEPLPSLLAVFERHDVIEGCFDEDAQGMLELIPEPNLIFRLNGEDEQSVHEAFRILAVLCETLVCASRLMKMMPGNELLEELRGDY